MEHGYRTYTERLGVASPIYHEGYGTAILRPDHGRDKLVPWHYVFGKFCFLLTRALNLSPKESQ